MPRVNRFPRGIAILACAALAVPACNGRQVSGSSGDEDGGGGSGSLGVSADDGVDGGEDSSDSGDDGAPAECFGPSDLGSGVPRRLTGPQLVNTVHDLTGVQLTDVPVLAQLAHPFLGHAAPLVGVERTQYASFADEASKAADVATLVNCGGAADDACASDFIDSWGRRAFRRQLTEDERADLLSDYQSGPAFEDGIREVIRSALSSDAFIVLRSTGGAHPTEPGVVVLDNNALAWRLSYFLWNGPPDDALLDAAEAGVLTTPEKRAAEAERLLADPRALRGVGELFAQLTHLDRLGPREGDTTTVEDPAVLEAMTAGARAFVHHVFLADALFSTLLRSPQGFANAELAVLYGDDIVGPLPATSDLELVDFDPALRSGLFGQAGVIAANSNPSASSPTHRGNMLLDGFLCLRLPPSPPEIGPTDPPDVPPSTTREAYEWISQDPLCADCHLLMDPLGFAFENYDAAGLYRTEDNGFPIDASGKWKDLSFDGLANLVDELLADGAISDCVAQRYLEFALRRPAEEPADDCIVALIRETFEKSGGDLRALALAVVHSDAFTHERPGE